MIFFEPAPNSDDWNPRVRGCFWIVGLLAGGVLAYTTRYYINSDACVYIEMGEMFVNGRLEGLVNLTFSPFYAVLLGIGQVLIGTDPLNELIALRPVNFLCLIAVMAGCDFMMAFMKTELAPLYEERETPLPFWLLSAACYAMLLIAALIWIRMRLINPDMLILFWTCISVSILLWIRQDPDRYSRFAVLGAVAGVGYLTKAFFWMFSPALFLVAALTCGSLKKAVPRVLVSLAVMVVLISPLVTALSQKKGSLTFGEGGRHTYALDVAGRGEPLYQPPPLARDPEVIWFDANEPGTRPYSQDVTYWTVGIEPEYRVQDHVRLILKNIRMILVQTPWVAGIILWFVYLWWIGSFRVRPIHPPSLPLALLVPGIAGIGLFCLIRMETRYIAPFLFISFVGGITTVRLLRDDVRARSRAGIAVLVLLLFLVGLLVHSVIDQTIAGLYVSGPKLSWRDSYRQHIAVKDYLAKHGIKPGDSVAVVGHPPGYWARMGGLRILGQVEGPEKFLSATEAGRSRAVEALKKAGARALLGYGSAYAKLRKEGWKPIPRTRSYYGILLDHPRQRE